MNDGLKMSERGLALVRKHEGLRLTAYRCPAGVLTIGYGHTHGVKEGMRIDLAEAERFLREDIATGEDAVKRLIDVPLTQGQFDALVDFVLNLGSNALQRSTLRRILNNGDYWAAAQEFGKWVYARDVERKGRKVALPGLIARRDDERVLFEGGGGIF